MNLKYILILIIYLFLSQKCNSQDTIRIDKKPKIILHSWYPEYKEFTKLKIGDSKLFFTITKGFENSIIRKQIHNHDVNLTTSSSEMEIEETPKKNQFIVKVNASNKKYIELQAWLDLQNKTLLIKQNGKWKNATEIYKFDGQRILIDTVKLELVK